ncbi:hypothetical protein Lsai_2676 [Legionella sainthelensi]|uniref:Uncharacterized protein n=1 Tax=Legionella sainthelensi TaxID=28087 RepID=A0A0W0YDT4_9GAMM|nr:hypothetical protein [Legionella sainthelensi]KTD55084.1 hypothetical protein Lsai_2676 [Legionella sainthelensi]VEH36643.1 Uncharacterised protein [Legionella sainthelensi]
MKSRQERHDFFSAAIKTTSESVIDKKVQLISNAINRTQYEINTIQENIDKSEIGIKLLQLFDQIQVDEHALKLAIEEKKEGLQALAQELINMHKKEYKILEEKLTRLDQQLNESKQLLSELNQQLKELLQSSVSIKPL